MAAESRNMAAILQLIVWQRHVALVYSEILDILWSIDTCQNKVSVTSITWLYSELWFKAHGSHVFVFFFKLTASKVLVNLL